MSDADQWRVFDCRHSLADTEEGRNAWFRDRIPRAYFLHMDTALSGKKTGLNGRHPLPSLAYIEKILAHCTVGSHTKIVVYDDKNGSMAARAWWLFKHAGLTEVYVLDGGYATWQQRDLLTETGAPEPDRDIAAAVNADTPVIETPGKMPTLDAERLAEHLRNQSCVLIDARAYERYSGKTEPLDPVAGHIPSAINRPFASNLLDDGRFKSAEQLRQEWTSLIGQHPATHIVHQCGSGVTACHNILAMEIAGLNGSALYPGSWSEWCANPNLPIAVGECSGSYPKVINARE